MKRIIFIRALLAGSALFISTAALAQEPEAQPDASDATADAAIQGAQALDDAQAKIELLQAQVEALQEAITQIQTAQAKALPSWKGAPQLEDKDAGFSFKPKGLLQYDAGYVGFPNGDDLRGTNSGVNFANLGWSTRARRLTFGADGTLPGGFRYSAEFNFAQAGVDFEDVLLAYDFKNSPITAQIGYFYPFASLETMTSSKYTSFMERAGITDAFSHNRRIGAALVANDKTSDKWVAQAGIFSEEMNNADVPRTGWAFAARGVFSPTLGEVKLHLGANYEHRVNRKEAMGRQYRARPMTQITDVRFIDTTTLASKGDDIFGLEAAAIFKQFHFAAEAQKVWVRGIDAAEAGDINGDPESNETTTGALLNGDPSFWGGYAEVGFYLTGETRSYKGGSFGRVKVLKPFDKGGWGALQINGRVDYVDLNDRVADSATFTAPNYVNGGKQIAYQASLIWNPTDYVRFLGQYSHINVTGGPRNGLGDDLTDPANEREFDSDVFTMRAQIDF
ncbi:porin [Sphingomonas sp. RB56-2]|uniref:Porin n=1 Tax=Sphingomonas brevis TaxID=2908206 RepID=A0ABT0SBA8_9SPHN|nr:porin [Sphingomonas brevis]MCL6741684.1 porin [Sphingomonas brevis]